MPDEEILGKRGLNPDDFGLRSHVIQKPCQPKSATSPLARVWPVVMVYHRYLLQGDNPWPLCGGMADC